VLQGLAASALPLGTFGCASQKANSLVVGGLPVTCNLTLPVACVGREKINAQAAAGGPKYEYEYSKYNGWPEIKESLMAGRIQAGYMLAPLVMDLADKGIPVKIVSLGHRSGAVIMVRTDSPYQHFKQLTGKRVAVPSRFAVDYLFLRRMLAQEDMQIEQLEIVVERGGIQRDLHQTPTLSASSTSTGSPVSSERTPASQTAAAA